MTVMPFSVLQIAAKPATAVQKMAAHQHDAVQIPTAQRRPLAKVLQQIEGSSDSRNAAIVAAHATGAYAYQQIAKHVGIHFTTVGRMVRNGS